MKNKETLEEAAENYTKDGTKHFMEKTNVQLGFIAGAKWQKNRLFTNDEVIDILQKRLLSIGVFSSYTATEIWFEQFKKK